MSLYGGGFMLPRSRETVTVQEGFLPPWIYTSLYGGRSLPPHILWDCPCIVEGSCPIRSRESVLFHQISGVYPVCWRVLVTLDLMRCPCMKESPCHATSRETVLVYWRVSVTTVLVSMPSPVALDLVSFSLYREGPLHQITWVCPCLVEGPRHPRSRKTVPVWLKIFVSPALIWSRKTLPVWWTILATSDLARLCLWRVPVTLGLMSLILYGGGSLLTKISLDSPCIVKGPCHARSR